MSFLKIKNPRKRDQLVADFIATKKRIQQRNADERAGDLAKEGDLQNLFKPVIHSTEKSTAALQNELKGINEKLDDVAINRKEEEEKIKRDATDTTTLEDILERYNLSNPFQLDPYFGIQRVRNSYMMGTKKVTFDNASNIYIDDKIYEGTLGLWKLIMMAKPPQWDDRKDLSNYELIVTQTDVARNPRNVLPKSRPYQTYKYTKILRSLPSFQQSGSGIQFLPADIKALEQKLEILLGEYRAGNRTSTRNEIVAIADELLRRKNISRQEYRDINTFLSEP